MSELEELKARAKERSNHRVRVFRGQDMPEDGPRDLFDQLSEAEGDLDRAIEGWWNAQENLANHKEALRETEEELNEARAAVLTGRDRGKRFDEDPHDILGSCRIGSKNWRPCSTCDGMRKWLADTESFEQFR